MKRHSLLFLFVFVCFSLFADKINYQCQFTPAGWQMANWKQMLSPRWPNKNSWIQKDNRIENPVPADATPRELMGTRCPETYVTMVYQTPIQGSASFSCKMSFGQRMAPEIVLAGNINEKGEYQDYWEIVLYDQGINVWRHLIRNGKPAWYKLASAKYTFKPGEIYDVRCSLSVFKNTSRDYVPPTLTISINNTLLHCVIPDLIFPLHVGICGCEGPCAFYDFSLKER